MDQVQYILLLNSDLFHCTHVKTIQIDMKVGEPSDGDKHGQQAAGFAQWYQLVVCNIL